MYSKISKITGNRPHFKKNELGFVAGELGCDILQTQNLLSGDFFFFFNSKKKSFLLPVIQTLKYAHFIRKYFLIVLLPLTRITVLHTWMS